MSVTNYNNMTYISGMTQSTLQYFVFEVNLRTKTVSLSYSYTRPGMTQ